jgi:superfamily II DNA/RNA helicase
VFVRTKRGADRLVKRLGGHGVHAAAIHGNKSQRQREQALARFQSGAVDTLVATDVAARGIDVKDISHVINYDPPGDAETYVHRVGRTGRAGATGIGITLVAPSEHHEVSHMARTLGLDHPAAGARATPRGGASSYTPSRAPSHPSAPSHAPRGPRSRRRAKSRRPAVRS